MTIFDAHGVLTFRARHRIRESLKGGGGILYYLYLSSNLFFLALVLLFIVTYSFSMMVNFIVKKYVFRTGSGRMDRVFATVFGVMRGCLFIVVLTILARFTSLPEKPAWRSSLLVSYFEQVAEQAWQILPEA